MGRKKHIKAYKWECLTNLAKPLSKYADIHVNHFTCYLHL